MTTTLIDARPGLLTPTANSQLRAACGEAVHVPGDPGYDAARLPWQVNTDQRPAAVAYPASAQEAAAVVRIAAAHGLRVAAQGTGHNAAPLPALDATLLVRTSALNHITIDPAARRATVGSGTLWGDVVDAAARHGLAALHGSSPDVGVAGYSLGGGMGWYARKLGLQCNRLTAVELVTADGRLVRCSADVEPDLFWAVRGGGGSFGVVTAFEFELFPITSAYAGWLVWDWHEAARVVPAWVEWTRTAPEEVTTSLRIMQLPPIPEVPEPLRGRQIVAVDGAVLGDEDDAARLLAPLRALEPEMDLFTHMAAVDLCRLHGDPEGPTPALSDTAMLTGVHGDAQAFADAFVAAAGPTSGSTLMVAELRQLGGALGRPAPDGGAVSMLDGEFVLFGVGVPMDAESASAITRDARRLVAACTPWASGRTYLNFTEHAVDTAGGYDARAYARLVRIRESVDPHQLFLANHPVPTAV